MAKRIVILGAGESGTGAAVLAKKQGFDTFVSDMSCINEKYKKILNDRNIEWEEAKHTEALILNADEIIKSPGIPHEAPIIQKLKNQGTPIISEIEFAGRYTDAKMICITGSNGKTTTTSLIYHIFKNAGYDVGLAGNIGNSLALQVAEEPHEYYVIELSSFQLDYMYEFKADISVLLNITPDHLDRYEYKFQNYIDAKMRITQNQTEDDVFIYWNDDEIIQKELEKIAIKAQKRPFSLKSGSQIAAYTQENTLCLGTNNGDLQMELEELGLRGQHNLYNSMAAALSAASVHIQKESIRNSLRTFDGVEHRLESVCKVKGVEYINDSKATNVNSCWYALESMTTPTILILGGTDKGNDYSEIDALVQEKCHTLIFMGKDNEKLIEHFGAMGMKYISTNNLTDAVQAAYESANEGDTVLLSPCCASFDLFKNYEDRGEQFMQAVRTL